MVRLSHTLHACCIMHGEYRMYRKMVLVQILVPWYHSLYCTRRVMFASSFCFFCRVCYFALLISCVQIETSVFYMRFARRHAISMLLWSLWAVIEVLYVLCTFTVHGTIRRRQRERIIPVHRIARSQNVSIDDWFVTVDIIGFPVKQTYFSKTRIMTKHNILGKHICNYYTY